MSEINLQQKLIDRISKGDEGAFEEMFHTFHARLHGFAYSFLKSKELSDEVVMDVFVNLWKRRDNLKSIKNIETYLFVSVRNLAYTLIKKEIRYNFDELKDVHIDLAKYHKTPETSIISQENLKAINEAVEMLPPKCKMVFKLIREEGFSKKEAAEILKISSKTIDNQIAIAVKKIAEVLNIDLSMGDYSSHIQSFLLLL